ncbi:MAG: chitobiase/beta-hexosaminidase C-terminal domain-containing protein, partial [Bacteroidales bacterium]|nr:chitobiase/beta-hexosaminidase C-terminal domain-containing protein [Bacteroidales bacterium]
MKRRFTFMLAALFMLMTSFAWGQARTQINWSAADQGYENGQLIESVTFDSNVTGTFNKGTNSNAPKYYNTGSAIRCYGGNYFTVTTSSGNLTEIALTFATGEGSNEITTDVGTYSSGTWTGSASSVTFTIGGTSGHRRIAAFNITYSSGGTPTVATPTFSPAAGSYYEAQNVTISCTTEGATIYYTLDGSDPIDVTGAPQGSVYSNPIAISETTTVKAAARKQGMNDSNTATAVYTIEAGPTLITIAEAKALALNEYALVQGIVTFIDGKNVYVQDETAGIVLYLNANAPATLSLGDKVQGYGKRAVYKGLIELSGINANDASQFSVISTGNPLPLAEKTIAEINTDGAGDNMLQSTRVQIVNATIGTINTNNNTPLTQGENTLNIYKVPALDNISEGDAVDVIGVIGCFNNPQIRVAYASDVTIHETPVQTVATPTFTPEGGEYTESQTVTIACTTEGATIYYTLDGTNPTTNSTAYTTAITISETTTVKAFAVKAGMNDSNIATATYTIETGPTLITIAAARLLANNEYALVEGIVTFIDGRNVYIQDATAGIDLYLNSNTVPSGLALGDNVRAYGKKTVFNGLVELTGINGSAADQFSIISSGNTLPLAVKTIAEILADHNGDKMLQSTRVKIVDATVGAINTGNNTPITQGENTLNIYKMPVVEGLLEGDIATIIGIVGCYNNPQLRVASANDVTFEHPVVETVATPTFTPVAGTYTEAISVVIACTTEGTTIYYTLDGTDPAVNPTGINGTLYEAPFELSENTTVKAIAVKEGMNDSDIATAVYEFQEPTPPAQETSYTLITNANALISGDKYIIVGIKGETYKALGKQGTNNRPAVTVTPSNDTITVTPASAAGEDAVYELTLGQEGNYWTLYDAANEGYLYAASSSANHLKVQAENDANGQWTIEIASSGVATIKAQGTNTRNWLRLNSSGSPFSCYASGQADVYLYKAGDVPTPPAPSYYNVSVAQGITNGTVTVNPTTALEGDTITVTATPALGYELATLTYTYGQTTNNIDQTTMKFLMPASDVTVNATFTEMDAVATPTFTPAAGLYISAQTVTLECATEGATIYYTTDGTEPTTSSSVYAEPFTVSMTTTVKAFAAKEGMNNSAVATAEYTIIEVMTIASARALAVNEYALVQGIVTFIDGRNIYVQDATAGIDLFLNSNTVPTTLAIGDMVKAYGKVAVYNGLVELSSINGGNENQFLVLSSGNPLPLAVKTIAEILEDAAGDNMLQSTRVQIVDAICGTINTANNTPITQGESTLNIYKMPVVTGLMEGDIMTVIGVIGCYNNPQLRVASAADVTFTHPAGITVTPSALSGFNYVYEEGPSTVKTFNISAISLGAPTYIYASENYEISSFPGESFYPESLITINTYTGVYNYTIKVRLKAGLEIGEYNEYITICEEELDTMYIALSGNVTSTPPQPQGDYTRVSDLSQLTSGSKVIFAARFDENADQYYAMTAQASGKPEGVLFTSIPDNNGETLPTEITDAEDTFYWTVEVDGANYTFTNANGDVLGYNSSTNFATGGDNTAWTITFETSEATAMVPDYSAFVITNGNVTGRAFALNSYHNYGAYAKSNMTSDSYNFFIDMFATVGGGTLTCATPTFTPEAGTYYEAQEVAIACSTADATIYYTLDGSDPDENSEVYSEPISVEESMTIKAIAMKEGYENSNIATAEYTIIIGAVTIFSQDWEGDMNGWTFVTVEGGNAWNISQYQGNHYAYANGYNGGVNEQWCISPAFDLYTYTGASLTFRNAKNYNGPDVQLFFSNGYDGAHPATATWTELEFNKSTGSYAWAESGSIDLADFTGDECYIGFKYTSTE